MKSLFINVAIELKQRKAVSWFKKRSTSLRSHICISISHYFTVTNFLVCFSKSSVGVDLFFSDVNWIQLLSQRSPKTQWVLKTSYNSKLFRWARDGIFKMKHFSLTVFWLSSDSTNGFLKPLFQSKFDTKTSCMYRSSLTKFLHCSTARVSVALSLMQ